MKQHPTICYLCGSQAIENTDYEPGKVTRNSIIECSGICPPYETTDASRRFYLDREDGKKLPDDAKKKLIGYLAQNYKDIPIRVTTGLIKNLAGGNIE